MSRIGILGLVLLTSGCVEASNTQRFTSVIAWQMAAEDGAAKSGSGVVNAPMALRLESNGRGQATNFPVGNSTERDFDGIRRTPCLNASGQVRYSGTITWRMRDNAHFEVKFKDSVVVVASGDLISGYPDWSTIGIAACEGLDSQFWELKLLCGDVTAYDPRLFALAQCSASTDPPAMFRTPRQ